MLLILSFFCILLFVLCLFYYLKIQKIQLNLFFKTQAENNFQQKLDQISQENKQYQEKHQNIQQNIIELTSKSQHQQELLNEKKH